MDFYFYKLGSFILIVTTLLDIELMLTSLFASHHMQISTKNSSLVLSNVCFHGKLPLSAASYDLEKKAIMVILRIYSLEQTFD